MTGMRPIPGTGVMVGRVPAGTRALFAALLAAASGLAGVDMATTYCTDFSLTSGMDNPRADSAGRPGVLVRGPGRVRGVRVDPLSLALVSMNPTSPVSATSFDVTDESQHSGPHVGPMFPPTHPVANAPVGTPPPTVDGFVREFLHELTSNQGCLLYTSRCV